MIRRPFSTILPSLLAVFLLLNAGEQTVSAQDSRPSAPIPMLLELTLVDRTSMVGANPQHGEAMPAESEFLLTNASVELKSYTPDADEVISTGTTDAFGTVVFDLGERVPGSPFSVVATSADGTRYLSKQQAMSSTRGSLHLYRSTDDHSALEQAVMKIATLVAGEDPEAKTVRVQVRQIIQFQNSGLEVFEGPPDAPGMGFIFPVPNGVEVMELTVGEETIFDLEARNVGHWGYGVPIPKPVFPLDATFVIGRYEFDATRSEVFDIGFEAVVTTQGVQISLEQNNFTHDAELAAEWDTNVLPAMGAQQMPDVGRTVELFGIRDTIAAHTVLKVPVRFGPPGLSMMTVWMTLLIIGCFAMPVVVGIGIAKRRGGEGSSREAQLRALHASGELSDADFARELAQLGSTSQSGAAPGSRAAGAAVPAARPLPKDVLERLEKISSGTDASPEEVAKDVRELASIIRENFSGDSR